MPVVHDVHDLQSLRQTPYEDGFDDPEDPRGRRVRRHRGLRRARRRLAGDARRHRGAARAARPHAAVRQLRPGARPGARRGRAAGAPRDPPRVVYQGSLSDNGSHYDLRAQFAAIAASGLPIDVFPNRDAPAYRELAARTPGMRMMDTLRPADLLRALPAYDVGWAAFNTGLNAAAPRHRPAEQGVRVPGLRAADRRRPPPRPGAAWSATTASAWWSWTTRRARRRAGAGGPRRACAPAWPSAATASPSRVTSTPSSTLYRATAGTVVPA